MRNRSNNRSFVEKNNYERIIPVLAICYLTVVISFQLLLEFDSISVTKHECMIFYGSMLLFVIYIFFCLVMCGVTQARIVRKAYVNCLIAFNADPQFIQKIKNETFDIRRAGIWKKGRVFYVGKIFNIYIENILGPSNLGYRPCLVVSLENSLKSNDYSSYIEEKQTTLFHKLDFKNADFFYGQSSVTIKFLLTPKVKLEHIETAMMFLKNAEANT